MKITYLGHACFLVETAGKSILFDPFVTGTMDYQDAMIASDFIQCDRIIGSHFDTFGFIKIEHETALSAFDERNKELILMEIQSSFSIY